MNIEISKRLFEDDEHDHNERLFAEELDVTHQQQTSDKIAADHWNVLIVDDEEDIHSITQVALKGFEYRGKEVKFLHAYSAEEAKQVVKSENNIALILLDVVMETNNAGLEFVKYFRNELRNNITQIVLRTGYPGQAPEREVIVSYGINDYKTKTELTTFKLFTLTLASIRTYTAMTELDQLSKNLENKVHERTRELKKKNIQIMEMDQMKTRFFTNISHEFRTPLTLILSPLESKLLASDLNEYERDECEIMHRNGLRLLNLINQLQDLSKLDSGKMKLELAEYEIYKVMRLISGSFKPLALRNQVNYSVQIPNGACMAYTDYDKLEKITTNLLSNAFKFTPEQGEISIRVEIVKNKDSFEKYIQITVKDSGPGIPPEIIDKIFESFFQYENNNKRISGGTGIGLALTKELVNLMHGELLVESDEGKGSVFTVRLPLGKNHLTQHEFSIKPADSLENYPSIVKANVSNHSSISDNEQPVHDSDKPLALIVEDDEDLLLHLCELMNGKYTLLKATNGMEGIDLAIKHVPDIIITDYMMPEKDGMELCKTLKNHEITSHIPMIMLTARADKNDKLDGLGTGADDYLVKPFQQEELLARMNNLITQREKLKVKFGKNNLLEPSVQEVTSVDDQFIKRAVELVEQNIGDCNFDVNTFCPLMNLSRMQLFRKLKALTNQTPSEFIRVIRLKRAAQLFNHNFGNVAEVAYEVGFSNLSYFAKCFREEFGTNPSEYA